MVNTLAGIHILSWACNIIIGVYLQFRHGSTPPRYVGAGMYKGGFDPIIAGIVVGSIPIVSTIFVIYTIYLLMKGERL
jgi:hypothetical protein